MASFAVDWRHDFPFDCQNCALTIGNFDGVHRGHQALLAKIHSQADKVGGLAVALTFDPSPMTLLRPQACQPLLTTLEEKVRLLEWHGADHVVVLKTTPELLQLSAREFFEQILRQRLKVRVLVPGFNFGFGRRREGNVDTLIEFCREAKLPCKPVPPVVEDGQAISSSRVRQELQAGAVQAAAKLLGRKYSVRGTVVEGQRRGRTLGFPTANLEGIETLLPAPGVYAAQVLCKARVWAAAVNLGPNPTFGEDARKLEVHLIDFTGDLYGETLTVDFVERLRETKPFSSAAALIEQLKQDVEKARRVAGCI